MADSIAAELLHMASACILAEPKMKSILKGDEPTPEQRIYSLAVECCQKDPEFVFKLALYLRDDLNIRTTANFLFAVAAIHPLAGSYIPKYYDKFIRLPTDWMHVSLFAECLHPDGCIPRKLRNAMVVKFTTFNEFTLSKYKNKILTETGRHGERKTGMKRLIRLLHIGEKASLVVRTLGKKYPNTLEAFQNMGLDVEDDDWDSSLADSRMKLSLPITWETQISGKGNVAQVWHALLDKKGGLPFMALLRNLRNIILANVDEAHHALVTRRLTNEREVASSRQFPFAFLSAYTVLKEQLNMETTLKTVETLEAKAVSIKKAISGVTKGKNRSVVRLGGKGKSKGAKGGGKGEAPKLSELSHSELITAQKTAQAQYTLAKDKLDKLKIVAKSTDLNALLAKYQQALNTAVKIATAVNVEPISGRSIIFCDVSEHFASRPVGGRQQSLSVTSLMDVALLLTCMFRHACENASIVLFNASRGGFKLIKDADRGDLLGSVIKLKEKHIDGIKGGELFPLSYLTTMLQNRVPLDNIVVLGDCYYGVASEVENVKSLPGILHKYRRLLSPDLLFVSVDFCGTRKPEELPFQESISTSQGETPIWWDANHPNNVYISGFSDSILRFVSTRGGDALEYVQNIDVAKKLPQVNFGTVSYSTHMQPLPELPRTLTKPAQLKVFVSSTFVDFNAERSAVQDIFPLVKNVLSRIDDHRLPQEISLVDLRWGVTTDCSALERCLGELSQCPVVIAFVGARYGYQVTKQNLSTLPDLDIFSHLRDRVNVSVTELELLQALEQRCHVNCYLRDVNFGTEFGWNDGNPKLEQLRHFLLEKNVVRLHNYRPIMLGPSVAASPGFKAQLLGDLLASIFRHCGVSPPKDVCRLIVSANNVIPRAPRPAESDHVLPPWLKTLREHAPLQAMAFQRFLTPAAHPNVERPASALLADFLAAGIWNDKKQVFALVAPPGYGKSWLIERLTAPEGVLLLKSTTTGSLDELLRTLCLQLWALGIGVQPWDLAEDEIFKCLTVGLRAAADGGKRILLALNHPCIKNAEWIPQNASWPASVKALVSLDVDTNLQHAPVELVRDDEAVVLDEKWSALQPGLLCLSAMDKSTSIELLNAVSASVGKKLTTGQQRKIVAKSDAKIPLYLLVFSKVLCNASFDTLETTLTKTPGILSELILVQKPHPLATQILLAESVSLEILQGVLQHEIENFSPADFADIVLSLAPLVDTGAATLRFHPFVRKILLKNAKKTLPMAHIALARFYALHSLGTLTTKVDGANRALGTSTCKPTMLVAHAVKAASVPLRDLLLELCHHVVCRPDYAQLRIAQDGGVAPLLSDMALLLPHFSQSTGNGRALREWRGFIMEKRSFLDIPFPQLCATMPPKHAVFQALSKTPVLRPKVFELFAKTEEGAHRQYSTFTWLNKPNNVSSCVATNVALHKSITSNDNMFAVANFRWEVRLFDKELTEVDRPPLVHASDVRCMAFNGNKLAVGLANNTCAIWDVPTGVCEHVLAKHLKGINSVDWVSLSVATYVITGGDDRKIGIWNLALNDAHIGFLLGHDGPVASVSSAPSTGMVASGSWDKTVRVWDLTELGMHSDFRTLAEIGKNSSVLKGHSQSIRAVSFKNRMKHVLSCSTDGTCRIWEPAGKTTLQIISVWPAEATTCSLAMDNNVMLLGTSDRSLFVYRASTATQPLLSLPGHGAAVVGATVQSVEDDPNEYKLLSISRDRLKLWNAHIPVKTARIGGKMVGQDNLDEDGTVRVVHSCPVSVLMRYAGDIVSVGCDGSVARWSSRGEIIWNRDGDASGMGVRCGLPMPAGQGFVVFGPFGHIHFDDRGLRTQPTGGQLCGDLSAMVLCGDVDQQAQSYVVGTFSGVVVFFQRGERMPQAWIKRNEFAAHDDWISSIAMQANGCLALSGSYDRRITVFSRSSIRDDWLTLRVVASFADWIVQVRFAGDTAVSVSENWVADLEHNVLLDANEPLVDCAFNNQRLVALGASGRLYHKKGSIVVRNVPGTRLVAADTDVLAVADLCGGVVSVVGASADYVETTPTPIESAAGQMSVLRKVLEEELRQDPVTQEADTSSNSDSDESPSEICISFSSSEESPQRQVQKRQPRAHKDISPEIAFGLHLF